MLKRLEPLPLEQRLVGKKNTNIRSSDMVLLHNYKISGRLGALLVKAPKFR